MDSHSLLQGIFPTQGSNPGLPHCRQFFTIWATREAPSVPYFIVLAVPCGMWDLSSLSRDWTCTPCTGPTGPPGKSLYNNFKCLHKICWMNLTPTPTFWSPVCLCNLCIGKDSRSSLWGRYDYCHLIHGKTKPRVIILVRGRIGIQTQFVCLQNQRTSHSRDGLVVPRGECGLHVVGMVGRSSPKTVSLEEVKASWARSLKNLPRQKMWTISFP